MSYGQFRQSVADQALGLRHNARARDGWGGDPPIHGVPVFVVSHNVPKKVPKGATPFTFVTDGIASAIRQAKQSAGDKNVYVLGGANVAQQCMKAGLLDEIWLHLVPILLGDGIQLFDHLGKERQPHK